MHSKYIIPPPEPYDRLGEVFEAFRKQADAYDELLTEMHNVQTPEEKAARTAEAIVLHAVMVSEIENPLKTAESHVRSDFISSETYID